jgi:hypothetical protein
VRAFCAVVVGDGLNENLAPRWLAHGDKFFGRRRVNADRGVESFLGRTGAHRHRKALRDFARVFAESGCNIEVVLIDTEAHKALDVFYLTSQGRKLTENEQFVLEDRLRVACLG